MMRHWTILAAPVAIALTLAVALWQPPPTLAPTEPVLDGPVSQQSGDAYDRTWLQQMTMHHAMAVMMARPVVANAAHPELRDLGASIIADQTREIAQMRDWLRAWYGMDMPDPIAMMDAMHTGQMPQRGPGGPMDPASMPMAGMHPPAMPMGRAGMGGMGMPMGDMSMMADLETLPPARLEAVFMSLMIPHHQGAIDMANQALARAAHPELKALAEQIITSQAAEIEQLGRWLADWYGL